MMRLILAFLNEEQAVTAVEYAVLIAMIIMTALAAIATFGGATNDIYGDVQSEMDAHGVN